jgi:Putative peptidoglycan binding domain
MKASRVAIMLLAGAAFLLAPSSPGAAEPAAAAGLSVCTKERLHTVSTQGSSGTPFHTTKVPASSSGNRNCLIGDGYVGCAGPDCLAIKRLQRSLNFCHTTQVKSALGGGRLLRADGYWGPNTRKALQGVQRHLRIDDDGIYGPGTRNAMLHLSDGDAASSARHCHRFRW